MTFQTEFPDYPAADMPAIPAGFADVSWHNDVCPSFEHPEGFRLFIDYADDSLREFPGGARFTLHCLDDVTNATAIMLETSSWNEMNAALLDYTAKG